MWLLVMGRNQSTELLRLQQHTYRGCVMGDCLHRAKLIYKGC